VIACADAARRIAELLSLSAFRQAYATVRQLFVSGQRDVVFPLGTYLMRKLGVVCEPFPDPAALAR
jgi:hypothetical protein